MNTPQHEQRIQTVCLAVLATVAIGAALYWLHPVLIPLVLAVFFSYCLAPIIEFQMRHLRIPRPVAFGATVLLGGVLLVLIGTLVSASVGQMAEHAGDYQDQITQLINRTAAALPLERFGVDTEELTNSFLQTAGTGVASFLTGTVGAIMNVLSNGLLVLIFMIFMMLGKAAAHEPPPGDIRGEVESRIKRYILAMVTTSAITGVLVGATLTLLGVDFALVFGLLAFLFNFIPNIGSVIATLLPVPVALLSPELSVTAKVLVIVIPGGIQFVIGNLVQPKVMGRSLDLHPVVVLIALIFFGMIWGIVGMFLATPITAVLKILLERVPYTAPIAAIMAGRFDTLPAEPSG